MSQAHKGSRLLIQDVVYAVPHESAHFSFNEDPTGIQNGNIIYPDSGAVYTMRGSEGKYGSSIAVEEGTTNLWTGNMGIYNNYSVPATLVQTGEYYKGQPVWRLGMTVPTGTATATLGHFKTSFGSHGVMGGGASWVTNTKYVSSIYWKPVNKQDVVVGGIASNSAGWSVGGTDILSDGWKRFYRYRTGAGVATVSDSIFHSFYCPSLAFDETVYIDFCCPQTEIGRITPTSYVSGTRANGRLYYDHPLYGANEGTINFWLMFTSAVSTGTSQVWWWDYNNVLPNGPWIGLGSDMVIVPFNVAGASFAGTWNMYTAVRRANGSVDWYMNGVKKNTSPSSGSMFNSSKKMAIGSHLDSNYISNILMNELRMDRYAASDEEVLSWFISNKPFYNPYDYRAYAY